MLLLLRVVWLYLSTPLCGDIVLIVFFFRVVFLPAGETTLQRKRAEYSGFIEQYYNTAQKEEKLVHQIHIDVLRTNPTMPDFHNEATHQVGLSACWCVCLFLY